VRVYDRRLVLDDDFADWLHGIGTDVVIDVARIDAVDQQLLSRLLRLRRAAVREGTRLALVCRPADRQILELGRFDRSFRLSLSCGEALPQLEASPATARTG